MHIALKIIEQSGHTTDVEHEGSTITLGRDPNCDITLGSTEPPTVSWLHAQIESQQGLAILRDFHSKNGTFVNDTRITETSPLNSGDTIRLGERGPKLILLALTADPPPPGPVRRALSHLTGNSPNPDTRNDWIVRTTILAAVLVLALLLSLIWLNRTPEPERALHPEIPPSSRVPKADLSPIST